MRDAQPEKERKDAEADQFVVRGLVFQPLDEQKFQRDDADDRERRRDHGEDDFKEIVVSADEHVSREGKQYVEDEFAFRERVKMPVNEKDDDIDRRGDRRGQQKIERAVGQKRDDKERRRDHDGFAEVEERRQQSRREGRRRSRDGIEQGKRAEIAQIFDD